MFTLRTSSAAWKGANRTVRPHCPAEGTSLSGQIRALGVHHDLAPALPVSGAERGLLAQHRGDGVDRQRAEQAAGLVDHDALLDG